MPKQKSYKTIYKNRARAIWPILRFLGVLIALAMMGGALTLLLLLKDLPRPEKFTESEIAQSTKIYDREGKTILYEIAGDEKRTLVPLARMSPFMQQAIVATEDQNFYQHQGVDFKAIARAVLYKSDKPLKALPLFPNNSSVIIF